MSEIDVAQQNLDLLEVPAPLDASHGRSSVVYGSMPVLPTTPRASEAEASAGPSLMHATHGHVHASASTVAMSVSSTAASDAASTDQTNMARRTPTLHLAEKKAPPIPTSPLLVLFRELCDKIAALDAAIDSTPRRVVAPAQKSAAASNTAMSVSNAFVRDVSVSRRHQLLTLMYVAAFGTHVRAFRYQTVAFQLSFIEHELFCRIDPSELLDHKPPVHPSPNIAAISDFFNYLTRAVEISILEHADANDRALIIHTWIKIGAQLLAMRNFQTLKAIVSALGTPPLSRLKKTWNAVPRKSMALLKSLKTLMSEEENYNAYRQALAQCSARPVTPYFGLFLHDFTYLIALVKKEHGNPASDPRVLELQAQIRNLQSGGRYTRQPMARTSNVASAPLPNAGVAGPAADDVSYSSTGTSKTINGQTVQSTHASGLPTQGSFTENSGTRETNNQSPSTALGTGPNPNQGSLSTTPNASPMSPSSNPAPVNSVTMQSVVVGGLSSLANAAGMTLSSIGKRAEGNLALSDDIAIYIKRLSEEDLALLATHWILSRPWCSEKEVDELSLVREPRISFIQRQQGSVMSFTSTLEKASSNDGAKSAGPEKPGQQPTETVDASQIKLDSGAESTADHNDPGGTLSLPEITVGVAEISTRTTLSGSEYLSRNGINIPKEILDAFPSLQAQKTAQDQPYSGQWSFSGSSHAPSQSMRSLGITVMSTQKQGSKTQNDTGSSTPRRQSYVRGRAYDLSAQDRLSEFSNASDESDNSDLLQSGASYSKHRSLPPPEAWNQYQNKGQDSRGSSIGASVQNIFRDRPVINTDAAARMQQNQSKSSDRDGTDQFQNLSTHSGANDSGSSPESSQNQETWYAPNPNTRPNRKPSFVNKFFSSSPTSETGKPKSHNDASLENSSQFDGNARERASGVSSSANTPADRIDSNSDPNASGSVALSRSRSLSSAPRGPRPFPAMPTAEQPKAAHKPSPDTNSSGANGLRASTTTSATDQMSATAGSYSAEPSHEHSQRRARTNSVDRAYSSGFAAMAASAASKAINAPRSFWRRSRSGSRSSTGGDRASVVSERERWHTIEERASEANLILDHVAGEEASTGQAVTFHGTGS